MWTTSDFWDGSCSLLCHWDVPMGTCPCPGLFPPAQAGEPPNRTEKWVRSGCTQTEPSGRGGATCRSLGVDAEQQGRGGKDTFGTSWMSLHGFLWDEPLQGAKCPCSEQILQGFWFRCWWCRAGEGQGQVGTCFPHVVLPSPPGHTCCSARSLAGGLKCELAKNFCG